ncbi:hypothetical protein OIV83_003884 [Microbotryomycetes sp. JL201]|nr:hypothetical protein OIV83_003884 [Microbotryomycetes sp. JL201]
MTDFTTQQPLPRADPHIAPVANDLDGGFDAIDGNGATRMPTVKQIANKVSTKKGWLGDFDFRGLCMPTLPWTMPRSSARTRARPSPFFGVDDDLPLTLAIICGLQHALASIAGIVTPPIIFGSQLNLSPQARAQLVAVSLLVSGFGSIIQMTRWPIPFTKSRYWFGTGIVTIVGTSFATLSTGSSIFNAMYADGTCPSTTVDGQVIRGACPEAYGYLLGTSALCSITTMALSFLPARALRRIFPPIVTGSVILMIGCSLVGKSGALNWMGGTNCAARPATGLYSLCPTINGPHPLPWGSAEYFGLGFLSFVTIILLEFFGSPAMKSASIVLGLLVGCVVAAPLGYTSAATIKSAPAITFLWVDTYPLRVYGPAILPMICVYVVLAMEAAGDISASSEVSRQPVTGRLFESRIQGGILNDGINGLLAALAQNPPVSIFAQNNGVLAITRVCNRAAGYWCAVFLIIFGLLSKISGIFLAIPNSVLGGVTTFLFASVAVSGLKLISLAKFTRRDRMILASALSLGLANLMVSNWASYIFTYDGGNKALKGFYNALIICLSTPYLIVGLVASLLNWLLPNDPEDEAHQLVDDDGLERGVPAKSDGDSEIKEA